MTEIERKPVIVTFKEKAEPEVVLKSAEAAKVPFIHATYRTAKDLPLDIAPESIGYVIEEAKSVTASLPDAAIDDLKKNPAVEMVEDDTMIYAYELGELYEAVRPVVPPYKAIPIPWPPCGYTDKIPWGVDRIDAERAWEVTQGKGIRVAVADTGIDYRHRDLRLNFRGGASFVPGEPGLLDHDGHGTHVAGTIAARRNCWGVVGVAPSAYLYAVKVLNARRRGRWSYLMAGLEWCMKYRMDVVNMSLGAATAPTAVERICQLAWKRGILLVAAAGNSAYPGAPPCPVGYPAKFPSVIAVSNIDINNVISPRSCRGPEVELCAPGTNILSTLPNNRFGRNSGTSMASPHVAGAAALALSSHRYAHRLVRTRAPVVIRRLLAWTADNLGRPGRDELYGFGIVDAEQAAFERRLPPRMPGIPEDP